MSESARIVERWFEDIFTRGDLSAVDDTVARYSGWTTYRGGLLDIPSEDQRILETGTLIYRIEDGKIKEIWSEMSDLQVVHAFPVADPATDR